LLRQRHRSFDARSKCAHSTGSESLRFASHDRPESHGGADFGGDALGHFDRFHLAESERDHTKRACGVRGYPGFRRGEKVTMAALKGKAKAAFLERMAKGRRKAARGNPKKKAKKKQTVTRPPKQAHRKSRAKAARPRKNARRRNQETSIEEASQMFEQFHGKRPGRIVEYDQPYNYPDNFAELGKLKELRFDLDQRNKNFPLTNFGACQTVSTPDGSNIYFIGGDQRIDFEALNIASDKDFVELGPATYIMYHTVKGFHDFDPTDYYHSFGEDDGILPVLVYDRLNHTLFLIGGNYRVRPEGIVN
jgi:hypothetical protein